MIVNNINYEDYGISNNSSIKNAVFSSSFPEIKAEYNFPEDCNIRIGNDFSISGKELKNLLKILRKFSIKEYPEEFL